MADANADNSAELHPEDAPSKVQLFDEDSDGGDPPARGRGAGNRNRPRDRSPENDTALKPEDAPSEVQLFDEDPEEPISHPRRQGAGRRNASRGGSRGRAQNTARRETRRAQNPPRREPHGRAQNPPRRETRRAQNPPRRESHGRAQNPHVRDSGGREHAQARHKTTDENRDERRRENDRHGRARPRKLSTTDELRPNTREARHFRDVENIRKKIYRVPKEQAGDPIEDNHYRWYTQGYVPDRHGGPEKRQIIVEGGPERIDVLFDEDTPTSDIYTWIAEKILEQKGLGPRVPRPGEKRAPNHDSAICCSILSQSTKFLPGESAYDENLNVRSFSASYPNDEDTLVNSPTPRLRLRGGAGSHVEASEPSASPLQPFDMTSDEDNGEGNDENRAKSKGKGKQRESSQSPVQSSADRSDEDHHQHSGPSRVPPGNRHRRRENHMRSVSSSHRSRRTGPRSPSEEETPIQTADETLVADRQSGTLRNTPSSRPRIRGSPYRLRRIKGRRTARHDEERAKLSDPSDIVIHIRRNTEGKHRTRIRIEGIEDRFHTRERDNDMSSEEIAAHIVAALEHSWGRLGRRPRSPSPSPPPSLGCPCVII